MGVVMNVRFRNLKGLLFFTICYLLLTVSTADAASISFKNSQIQISSPSSNCEAFQDCVLLEGISSLGTIWFCVRGPNNEIVSCPVQVTNNAFSYNLYLRFGPGKYTIWAGDNGSRFDGSIRFEVENVQVEDSRYLLPSPYIDSDNKDIINLAASLAKPQMTDLQKISAIHDWVAKNVRYDAAAYYAKENELKKASQTAKEKTGMCRDYSFLVAALARASGLPAKVVYGTARDSNNTLQDHAWNEVLINNKWISIDAAWDAGYLKNGEFVFAYSDKYFNPDPGIFAQSHSKTMVALH